MRILLSLGAAAALAAPVADAPRMGGGGPGGGPVVELAPDTVVDVGMGDELVIETWRGSLTVRVGEDDEVRMAGGAGVETPGLARSGSVLRLVGAERRGSGDLVLTVPRWLPVRIHSRSLDVEVDGMGGGVTVEVLEGDLRLASVTGSVEASTLDGEIEVTDADGDLRLTALDGDVTLRRATGQVTVQSSDGDLELEEVEGAEVSAVTVDGDVVFRGGVTPGGVLSLSTHDGDVSAWLPAELGAEVEVSTFDGSFQSDYRVQTRSFRAGSPLHFTVGDGSARIVLQSFDGDIRLLTW
ncbi:MAG: DUF4097 family beta strand repeat protein [Gemmatimonadales bacterium]|nr:MAG: DUF4097 family beta strand repeat protein [Gemmatimonadales bacterium]